MVLLTAYIGQPFTSLAMETVKTHGAFGRVRNVLGGRCFSSRSGVGLVGAGCRA
jgi:hypothetical protein